MNKNCMKWSDVSLRLNETEDWWEVEKKKQINVNMKYKTRSYEKKRWEMLGNILRSLLISPRGIERRASEELFPAFIALCDRICFRIITTRARSKRRCCCGRTRGTECNGGIWRAWSIYQSLWLWYRLRWIWVRWNSVGLILWFKKLRRALTMWKSKGFIMMCVHWIRTRRSKEGRGPSWRLDAGSLEHLLKSFNMIK